MNVLVTGGAGFIGSHLAARLLADGHAVRILDDLSTGHEANIPEGALFHRASILDPRALAIAIEGCDVVHHLAAVVSVPESVDDPLHCHEVNVIGTLGVLEAARTAGARRVVLASSCAVYGTAPGLPSRETDAIDPPSPYAASKAAAEGFASAFARCYQDLDTVSLRFFNVFGPRQDPSSAYAAVVAAFDDSVRHGFRPVLHGDGLQTRDFVAVANVVDALARAGARETDFAGMVLNVGTGTSINLLELLQAIARVHEREAVFDYGPSRPGDVRDSRADITRARAELGYEPVVTLDEGLRALRFG